MNSSFEEIAKRSELDAALITLGLAPTLNLVQISNRPFFLEKVGKKRKGPLLLGIRCVEDVMLEALSSAPDPVKFDFVTMRVVKSGGLFFGYLFEMPENVTSFIQPGRAHFIRTQKEKYNKLSLVFKDEFVNVFIAPQGAALITRTITEHFDPQLIREIKTK